MCGIVRFNEFFRQCGAGWKAFQKATQLAEWLTRWQDDGGLEPREWADKRGKSVRKRRRPLLRFASTWQKRWGKTASGSGTLQNQNLTGVTYLLGEGGAAASPVGRRKEGKKVNEGNVAVLEGTAGEASITATAGSPAGEGRGGGCAQRRRESR